VDFLSFWTKSKISFEADDKFLCTREMSRGVISYLGRKKHLIDFRAIVAALGKEGPDH